MPTGSATCSGWSNLVFRSRAWSPTGKPRTDLPETERRRLELAVAVSWQRNSGTYRNRVEELWYRLLRLEQGRFSPGSATMAEQPAETSSQ